MAQTTLSDTLTGKFLSIDPTCIGDYALGRVVAMTQLNGEDAFVCESVGRITIERLTTSDVFYADEAAARLQVKTDNGEIEDEAEADRAAA